MVNKLTTTSDTNVISVYFASFRSCGCESNGILGSASELTSIHTTIMQRLIFQQRKNWTRFFAPIETPEVLRVWLNHVWVAGLARLCSRLHDAACLVEVLRKLSKNRCSTLHTVGRPQARIAKVLWLLLPNALQ